MACGLLYSKTKSSNRTTQDQGGRHHGLGTIDHWNGDSLGGIPFHASYLERGTLNTRTTAKETKGYESMLADTFLNKRWSCASLTSIFSTPGYPKHNVANTAVTKSPDKRFVYDTIDIGTQRDFASPLPHEYGIPTGLPPEAVMGEITDGPDNISPQSFEQNLPFLQFLSVVMSKHSVACPGLIAETERHQDGYVYFLNKRTPTPDDLVPPEDIIGGVEIKHGHMLQFHASPNYRFLTKNGFLQLDDWLHARLVAELLALTNESDAK